MKPTLKDKRSRRDSNRPLPSGPLVPHKSEQIVAPSTNRPEPSAWHTIGRLFNEFIYIAFFLGSHWLLKLWLKETGQDKEWWAIYLLNVSILFAVIAFTGIFGSELIADCKHAVDFIIEQFKKRNE
jgi:hypothetical protein